MSNQSQKVKSIAKRMRVLRDEIAELTDSGTVGGQALRELVSAEVMADRANTRVCNAVTILREAK